MNAATARAHCAVCGASDLRPLFAIPHFPVFQGCVSEPPAADEHAPMSWVDCPACRSAQIAELPPLAHIYREGHATGLGAAWTRHHAAFAAFLARHATDAILDIGGDSGTLATAYQRLGGDASWTILEPHPLLTHDLPPDVARVESCLKRAAIARVGASTVVMCHMLEHVTDLRAAIDDITAALPENGRLIFAWPVLERWVEKGLAGALNFEHSTYVPLPALKALLARAGWRLSAEELWAENDTLFAAFARGAKTDLPLTDIPPEPGPLIADYFTRFRVQALTAMRAIMRHKGDVFLMPASIYAQALIAAGLTETRLCGLFDNAAAKHAKRLYGTELTVFAPAERLAAARTPLVIVNGGAHTPEMIEGLRRIRADVVVHDASGAAQDALAAPPAHEGRG